MGRCAILRTENGGLDWEEVVIHELQGRLVKILFDHEGTLFGELRNEDEFMMVSTKDLGNTWDSLYHFTYPKSYPGLEDIHVYGEQLYATTREGNILIIAKDGSSHRTIKVDEIYFYKIELIDENTFLAMSSNGLLKSFDGGMNWEKIADINGEFLGFASEQTGVIRKNKGCVSGGHVLYSSSQLVSTFDGGNTWGFAKEATTHQASQNFINSQQFENQQWRIMFGKTLYKIAAN